LPTLQPLPPSRLHASELYTNATGLRGFREGGTGETTGTDESGFEEEGGIVQMNDTPTLSQRVDELLETHWYDERRCEFVSYEIDADVMENIVTDEEV
jgi:hypothetical protein